MRYAPHIALCIVIFAGVYAYTRSSSMLPYESVVIETAHMPELLPHEHEGGDAVSDEGHHISLDSDIYITPRDIYVSGIDFQMVNAPASTLHHASLVDVSRPNTTCPGFVRWKELFIYASDRMYENTLSLPQGYALKIPKGSPLKLNLMIHNPEPPIGPGGVYHDVYTRVVLHESRAQPSELHLVEPYLLHLDDTACSAVKPDFSDIYTFTVPPQTERYIFSGERPGVLPASITFPTSGTLVYVAGHMHGWQGGKHVFLYRNKTLAYTFDAKPSNTTPYVYDTRHMSGVLAVHAGDVFSITAEYSNSSPVPLRGAMGMVGFYFAKEQ